MGLVAPMPLMETCYRVGNSTSKRWAIIIHMRVNPNPQLKKGLLEVFENISVESRVPRWLGYGKLGS